MMTIFEDIQQKIQNTVFFSNLGKADLDDNNLIQFASLESLLFSSLNFIWLPTSLTQEDPFYHKQINPKVLIEQRLKITKMITQQIKVMPDERFKYKAHDFNLAAKNALCYAFRQYLTEVHFNLGMQWQEIVELYFKGHWVVGVSQEKLVVI
ncbi:hypothetical protein [Proteus hauseri]|uniref:hypothetical protein n=1 Tax=Proteus hauseri TaxID=183417 RepID=UPI00100B6CF8|nr:hypothetical protein [Proteus hauseri]